MCNQAIFDGSLIKPFQWRMHIVVIYWTSRLIPRASLAFALFLLTAFLVSGTALAHEGDSSTKTPSERDQFLTNAYAKAVAWSSEFGLNPADAVAIVNQTLFNTPEKAGKLSRAVVVTRLSDRYELEPRQLVGFLMGYSHALTPIKNVTVLTKKPVDSRLKEDGLDKPLGGELGERESRRHSEYSANQRKPQTDIGQFSEHSHAAAPKLDRFLSLEPRFRTMLLIRKMQQDNDQIRSIDSMLDVIGHEKRGKLNANDIRATSAGRHGEHPENTVDNESETFAEPLAQVDLVGMLEPMPRLGSLAPEKLEAVGSAFVNSLAKSTNVPPVQIQGMLVQALFAGVDAAIAEGLIAKQEAMDLMNLLAATRSTDR